MQNLKNSFAETDAKTRRLFTTLGIITLAFIGFGLATISDLLAPQDINDYIVNPIPALLAVIGIFATLLAWKHKIRFASYLMIGAAFVAFFVTAFFTAQPLFSTIAELMIVVIPIAIAIQGLSEREFTWIAILSLIGRSAIQVLSISKASTPISTTGAQTLNVAQWASAAFAILFGLYIAINLNNYAFRIKMILVLGLLTIIPTAILTSISRGDLETNLIGQANQSLVLSSDQLASAFDSFIETTLDTTRTEAQVPTLSAFVGQPRPSSTFGGQLFPRGTDLERAANETLLAFLKKDPINIVSCRLMDNTGTVQLSTNQSELANFVLTEPFYFTPASNGLPYVSPISIADQGIGIIHFSAPVRNAAGNTIGVLDITYSASVLQQILVRNSEKLGANVSAMLLDGDNIILAHSSSSNLIYKIVNPPDTNTVAILVYENRLPNLSTSQLTVQMDGLTTGLENIAKTPTFSGNFEPQQQNTNISTYPDQAGAAQMQSLDWKIVAYLPQSTLLAPVRAQTQRVVVISIVISLVSIAIALGLTQVLVAPIHSLTATSEQISQGNINAIASVRTQDEIGELATTFNSMTGRIRDLVGSLEQRVAERTQALERRAVQLQAAADVGSSAARLRDLNQLMQQVTQLISRRFGFYHVGIFLVDDSGEFAVLRASNSEGGQQMLARGHKLKVGEVGIVGYVTGTGEARIALNVGQDAEFFNNPDLPLTQSEMALPLIAGGKILGTLDIQSTEEAAFTDEDVTTLKVLADQIAVALENARLFAESQAALESARRAYGEVSQRGWQHLLGEKQTDLGYGSFAEGKVLPVSGKASPEFKQAVQTGQAVLSKDKTSLHLPIQVRGQVIGAIRMDKPSDSGRWIPEEVTMAVALAEQLGTALESARLYNDISQRAARESIISEIASKIGASIQLDTILRTSVEELGRVLRDSEVIVQIGSQTNGKGQHE